MAIHAGVLGEYKLLQVLAASFRNSKLLSEIYFRFPSDCSFFLSELSYLQMGDICVKANWLFLLDVDATL